MPALAHELSTTCKHRQTKSMNIHKHSIDTNFTCLNISHHYAVSWRPRRKSSIEAGIVVLVLSMHLEFCPYKINFSTTTRHKPKTSHDFCLASFHHTTEKVTERTQKRARRARVKAVQHRQVARLVPPSAQNPAVLWC